MWAFPKGTPQFGTCYYNMGSVGFVPSLAYACFHAIPCGSVIKNISQDLLYRQWRAEHHTASWRNIIAEKVCRPVNIHGCATERPFRFSQAPCLHGLMLPGCKPAQSQCLNVHLTALMNWLNQSELPHETWRPWRQLLHVHRHLGSQTEVNNSKIHL